VCVCVCVCARMRVLFFWGGGGGAQVGLHLCHLVFECMQWLLEEKTLQSLCLSCIVSPGTVSHKKPASTGTFPMTAVLFRTALN
jgi:hypothetical protein